MGCLWVDYNKTKAIFLLSCLLVKPSVKFTTACVLGAFHCCFLLCCTGMIWCWHSNRVAPVCEDLHLLLVYHQTATFPYGATCVWPKVHIAQVFFQKYPGIKVGAMKFQWDLCSSLLVICNVSAHLPSPLCLSPPPLCPMFRSWKSVPEEAGPDLVVACG